MSAVPTATTGTDPLPTSDTPTPNVPVIETVRADELEVREPETDKEEEVGVTTTPLTTPARSVDERIKVDRSNLKDDDPLPTLTATTVPPTPTVTAAAVPPTPTATAAAVPPTPTATATTVPPTPTVTVTAVPPNEEVDVDVQDEVVEVPTLVEIETPVAGEDGVVCYEATGSCVKLELPEPISLSIPCGNDTIRLVEYRAGSRREDVGMCGPEIFVISDDELEHLGGVDASVSGDVALGSMFNNGGEVIRITGIDRREIDEESLCGSLRKGFECIEIGIEITNVGGNEDVNRYSDDDFSVVDGSGDEVGSQRIRSGLGGGKVTIFGVNFLIGDLALLGNERIQTAVVRYIPANSGDLYLKHSDGTRFVLGTSDHWQMDQESALVFAEAKAKEVLEHTVDCGWEYVYVELWTAEISNRRSSRINELDQCDPSMVSVPEEELAKLDASADTRVADFSNPVPFGEHYKTSRHAIRVVGFKRHEEGENCGVEGWVPEDHVCIGIELEVTKLWSDEEEKFFVGGRPAGYFDRDFAIVGGSGIAYSEGPRKVGIARYPGGEAIIKPGKR